MPSIFIDFIGNNPKTKVIDFLIDNQLFDFTKRDMERITKVSKIKLEKIFNDLIKQKIIFKLKKEGKFYRVNKNSEIFKALIELDIAILKNHYKGYMR